MRALDIGAQLRHRLTFVHEVAALDHDAIDHPDHLAADIGLLIGLNQTGQRFGSRNATQATAQTQ